MMKTKLKTMIGVLHPDTGKGNRVQTKFTLWKIFAVCLLAMVSNMGRAEDAAQRKGTTIEYDFSTYSSDLLFNTDNVQTVKNTSGETLVVLEDGTNNWTGSRFAVQAIQIDRTVAPDNPWRWFVRKQSNGLICFFEGHDNRLSIMGLREGDKVKITYEGNAGVSINNIKIHSNNVTGQSAGSDIVSGTEYTMSKSGSMDLIVDRSTVIKKVVIDDGETTGLGYHLSFDSSGKYGINTWGGVDYPYYRVQLSSRNFSEPIISTYPSTITIDNITFSIEPSTSVAVMNANPAYKGDVLFKNTGWCKVTASFTYGGTTYSDSYVVEVWDNSTGNYTVIDDGEGKKFQLTNQGILADRVIDQTNTPTNYVPGLKVTFGNPENNSTIIEERKDDNDVIHYVSFSLADNGWWDRWPYDANGWPTQGTYYVFEATSSGTLTFGGYKTSTGGEVKIVNANSLQHTVVFDGNTAGFLTSGSIVMRQGQRYYMHGTTPTVTNGTNSWDSKYNNQWAVFELEWFKFETGFTIVDHDDTNKEMTYGVAASSGVTNVTSREKISIPGVSVKSGSVEWKGGITNATATVVSETVGENIEYHIYFDNITYSSGKSGGAIKVTLQNGEGGKEKDYVMTIPYGTHVWDFRKDGEQGSGVGNDSYTDALLCTMMKNNTTNWCREYKVHNTSENDFKDPIMAATEPINGDNAFFMDNTAGLIFVTGNKSFGALQTAYSYSEGGKTYDQLTSIEQYNLGTGYSNITATNLLWMKGNATIYFPGVSANQYIKIYTYRHADNKGETFSAKNLVDLDNNTYNPNTRFIMRGMWEDRNPGYVGDDIRGAAIFRVPSNYVATQNLSNVPQLQLCDDGWTQIFRIEIMNDYAPDLMLTDDNVNNQFYPIDYDGQFGSVVIRKNSRKPGALPYVERTYIANAGQTGCQHANTCDYEIIADEGVVTPTRSIWNSKIQDITPENENNPSRYDGGVDYNKLKLTFNKAGIVRIVQRERANAAGSGVSTSAPSNSMGYVIDKNEYFINVGELTVQNYPYTWDFTNYNMYKGSSATETNLGAEGSKWSNPSTKTYAQQAIESQRFGVDQTDHNKSYTKALFPQGAQLMNSAGTAVAETEGLGISRPKTTKTYYYFATDQSDKKFKKMSRDYDGYTLTNGAIQINGNNLTGAKEILVPEVPNGMYIFIVVEGSGTPVYGQIKAGNTPLTAIWKKKTDYESEPDGGYESDLAYDFLDLQAGVYCYRQNTGSTQDVVIPLSSDAGQVKEIAVTNILKSIYSTGYATESRDHAIDHTYQEKFTNHPVKAYAITTDATGDTYEYRKKAVVRKSEPITVVPSNTGVVLCQESYSGDDFSSPLFYPAVNITPTSGDETKLATNRMAANVESTEHTSETEEVGGVDYTKFIMTTVSYTYHKEDGSNTQNTEATTEAFYRLKLDNDNNENNYIGANKAYLLIPTANLPTALWNEGSSSSRGIIYIDLEDVENSIEATKIDNQVIIDHSTDNNVYYSISGARINGKPTTKGFYIHNGKKVSIK